MFKKIKDKIKNRKDKKKIKPDRLKQVTANDTVIVPVNIHIFVEGNESIFRISTKEETPELHFENVVFKVETFEKKMKITSIFKEASQEKSFYIYDFLIEDFREYFA